MSNYSDKLEEAVSHGNKMYAMGEKHGAETVLFQLIQESIAGDFREPKDFWEWINKKIKGDSDER